MGYSISLTRSYRLGARAPLMWDNAGMTSQPNTHSERGLIAAMLATTLAHVLDFVIMMPLGPMLMSEFQLSAASFGGIISVYTFAAAGSSFAAAVWVDRVNRKSALIFLLLGFSGGNILCALAPSVTILLTGRMIAGLFGGVMSAVVFSIIGQVISIQRRGRATGVMGTAFPLVSIAGVPFGLILAEHFGWRMAFYLVLAVSAAAFVMILIWTPSVEPEGRSLSGRPKIWQPIGEVLQYRPHLTGIALMMITVMGGFVIVPYIAPFLINNRYIESDELYLLYLVGGCCSILSSRIIGFFADTKGKIKVLRIVLVGTALALAVFTNLPHHSFLLVVVVTSSTMVFLPGRFVCIMAFLTMICKPNTRGTFMSLISTIQQLTIGLASILGGLLVGEAEDGHLETFWLAGLVAISANMLILILSSHLLRLEQKALTSSTHQTNLRPTKL